MLEAISKTVGSMKSFLFSNGVKKTRNPNSNPSNSAGSVDQRSPEINFVQNNPNREQAKKPNALNTIISRRLQILKDAIEEIDRQIDQRKKLTGHFREQIDSEIEECQSFLGKLPYPWSEGFVPKMEFIRISLHKSLLTRRKDKRSEELSFWEDLTGLIKEKRKLMMEYEEIKNAQEKLS
jgi:hypothetical protein